MVLSTGRYMKVYTISLVFPSDAQAWKLLEPAHCRKRPPYVSLCGKFAFLLDAKITQNRLKCVCEKVDFYLRFNSADNDFSLLSMPRDIVNVNALRKCGIIKPTSRKYTKQTLKTLCNMYYKIFESVRLSWDFY